MKVFLGVVCLCFVLFAQSSATDTSTESSEIKALLLAYHDRKISDETKAVVRNKLVDLGHVFAHDRTKRQARDGSHWCCKIEDQRPDLVYPRTKLRSETEVRQETTRECQINDQNVFACTLETKNITTLTYHTYQDFSQALIVEQGEEPCPASLLTCCNKFFYFRALDHCASFADFKELLFIFSQFPDLPIWLSNVDALVAGANNGPDFS